MRTDVKLGVVLALVMVLTAGGYFMFRGERQKPISLADPAKDTAAGSKSPTSKPGTAAKPAMSNTSRPAANSPSRPPLNTRSQPNAANRPATPNTNPAGTTSTPTRPAIGTPLENKPSTASSSTPNPASSAPAPASAGTSPVGTDVKSIPVTDTTPGSSLASTSQPGPTITGSTIGLTGIPNPSSPTPQITKETVPASQPLSNPSTTLAASPNVPVSPTASELPPGIRDSSAQSTQPAPTRIDTTDAAIDTHRVQAGDTLTSLAQTYYGDTRYARFLADSNPKLTDPNRLRIGSVIQIPPLPSEKELRTAAGSPTTGGVSERSADGKRTYTVKAGDSFYSIAKSQLGNASRWKELLAINNSVVNGDPTTLQPGQRLVLPES